VHGAPPVRIAAPGAPAKQEPTPAEACRNCGAVLTGPFCAQCAQPAHLHRSLRSLGHDILHSVFHFEGKFWRTLPMLALHPGRLTRRYIDGERAKFVSPMALFLFTVFVMFAVFSFAPAVTQSTTDTQDVATSQREALAVLDRNLAELRSRLADPALTAVQRADIEKEIVQLETWRGVTAALSRDAAARDGSSPQGAAVELESDAVPATWREATRRLNENPGLLLYKLKTNGYKFSWALVPLSIPFMWLLFVGRRDIHLYDHAVFVTYSLSFMMLFVVVLVLLDAIHVNEDVIETAFLIVPPLHIYRQLRGAYRLSRANAVLRLVLVLAIAILVLALFGALLVVVGLLG
jgi:hypothetical protein